jgi:ferredoxin
MDHGLLPSGLVLQRRTDDFTKVSVPAGLLRAHRVARDVFGRVVVLEGRLRFVWEEPGADEPLDLVAGDSVVIPPDTRHRVEPGSSCRFAVEFYG